MTKIAGLEPDDARLILATVRYLRSAGLVSQKGDRGDGRFTPITPIYVKNASGEEVPPYACMQATGTEEIGGQNYLIVDKPEDVTGESGGYLLNNHEAIEIDGLGFAQRGRVQRAIKASGSMDAGEPWQPVVDAWTIESGGSQFIGIGDDDIGTDVARVFFNTAGEGEEVIVFTDLTISDDAICFCRKKIKAVVIEELEEICIPLAGCPEDEYGAET